VKNIYIKILFIIIYSEIKGAELNTCENDFLSSAPTTIEEITGHPSLYEQMKLRHSAQEFYRLKAKKSCKEKQQEYNRQEKPKQ
jgi:hypothetical protein